MGFALLSKIKSGKSPVGCWCSDRAGVRNFRFWSLNSYEEKLPEGWIGQIHDLTQDNPTPVMRWPDLLGGGVKSWFLLLYAFSA